MYLDNILVWEMNISVVVSLLSISFVLNNSQGDRNIQQWMRENRLLCLMFSIYDVASNLPTIPLFLSKPISNGKLNLTLKNRLMTSELE